VNDVISINIRSRRRPRWSAYPNHGALAGTGARARNIVFGDYAVLRAQEAVVHTAGVDELSVDHPRCVDVPGDRALARPGACALNIERGDRTVCSAHETVVEAGRINVKPLC